MIKELTSLILHCSFPKLKKQSYLQNQINEGSDSSHIFSACVWLVNLNLNRENTEPGTSPATTGKTGNIFCNRNFRDKAQELTAPPVTEEEF